jgi:hypothetical protein
MDMPTRFPRLDLLAVQIDVSSLVANPLFLFLAGLGSMLVIILFLQEEIGRFLTFLESQSWFLSLESYRKILSLTDKRISPKYHSGSM